MRQKRSFRHLLSTPSFGITSLLREMWVKLDEGELSFNSLFRDHKFGSPTSLTRIPGRLSTPSFGITYESLGRACIYRRLTFNSLFRDHILKQPLPSLTTLIPFQLPLSGSLQKHRCPAIEKIVRYLSTPSFGITDEIRPDDRPWVGSLFQLPLSGSLWSASARPSRF